MVTSARGGRVSFEINASRARSPMRSLSRLIMPLLGPIPPNLRATIERWIADARLNDPNRLHENNSLFITGGPAWCSSISPDGTIWIDDCTGKDPTAMTDESARIKTIVIAGKHRPELLVWLPARPEFAIDCNVCNTTGWQRLGNRAFVCETCSGLGWLVNI